MRSSRWLLAAALLLPCCARALRSPQAQSAPAPRDPVAMLVLADRARWVPEGIEGADVVGRLPDGTQQAILQRLRVEQTPGGALRRARDLLPVSRPSATAMTLPDRLGGGHLFVTSGNGSWLWRSRAFLGRLEPLVRLPVSPVQAVAGTDRLLVRVVSSDRVWGVDPDSGSLIAPLPLPTAPRYGAMAFVDGWRGVVHADLRGMLYTSDAGVTWKPLAMAEPPRTMGVEGELVTMGPGTSRQRFDPSTGTLLEAPPPPAAAPAASAARRGLWGGARPLRAAIEEGWPLLDGTAVVLRQGRVARVRLDDGEVLETSFAPLGGEEAATCQAVRFGADVGFVCGAPGRGTTIYSYVPPASAALALSFEAPRAVVPSQNGWLVVRGGCALDAPASAQAAAGSYCIVSPTGALREVFTRGDVGVERLVALADGRVAVVVPPRGPTDGQVTLLPAKNQPPTTLRLAPGDDAPALRRGLWLDTMYEVEPGVLGAWVEAGGLLTGLRIKLDSPDSPIEAGPLQEGSLVSITGSHAMVGLAPDLLNESLDGGLTWRQVEPPPPLGQGKLQPGLRCGVAGCAVPFERGAWLRVGWGPPLDPSDLDEAPEKGPSTFDRSLAMPLRLNCEPGRIETLKTPEPPRDAHPGRSPRFAQPPPDGVGTGPLPPFLDAPPPSPPAGALALSEATATGASARLYGWVPRGVAAGRAGRLMARFLDRFSPTQPIRSTSLAVASWRDEQALRDAFGAGSTNVVFHGLLDPGGHALLVSACQGSSCDLYSAVEGRPMGPLPSPDGEPFSRVFPPSASAVWLDEAFYLAINTGAQVQVWRLDPGRVQLLARVPRTTGFNNVSAPVTLVRRVHGRQLGLLARGLGTPARSEQDLYLLPIDPQSGQTGELLHLGAVDLTWAQLRACAPQDDGWLVDLQPPLQPQLRLPPAVRLGDIEVRVRLDPEAICVEALAAHLLDGPAPAGPHAKAEPKAAAAPAAKGVPLVAISGGRRLLTTCAP